MILRVLVILFILLNALSAQAQYSLAMYGGVNYLSLKEVQFTYYHFIASTTFPYYQSSNVQPGITLGLEMSKSVQNWNLAGSAEFRNAQIRPIPVIKVGSQISPETKIGLSTLGIQAVGYRKIKSSGFSVGLGLTAYYLLKPRVSQSQQLEYNIEENDFYTLGALAQMRYEFQVRKAKAFVQLQHIRYISQSQVEVQLRYFQEPENTYIFRPLFHVTQFSLGYFLFNHEAD
ncbi:MAG: hypothetical protein EP332_08480 [Bacteroidetes bacterium]|nr:MAG: hypothetical protein EP332_08480 [Bacteroidota bacterium]